MIAADGCGFCCDTSSASAVAVAHLGLAIRRSPSVLRLAGTVNLPVVQSVLRCGNVV